MDFIKKNGFVFFCLLAGIILRLLWNSDMEWKTDEIWMFEEAHKAWNSGNWHLVGMKSGGGIVNPGLSVWVFTLIAGFTQTPLEMNQVVEVMNVLAIIGFALFIFYKTKESERNIWLFGLALAAVSPLSVIFSRKIWAQDLLPFFVVIMIWAHAYRHKRFPAFIWGLIGAMVGQIHMSGFFFSFGLFAYTLICDIRHKNKSAWLFWVLGSAIGAVGMIPWIQVILSDTSAAKSSLKNVSQLNFFVYWFLDSWGINLKYSARKDFWDFLKMPVIAGFPTYLAVVFHVILLGGAAYSLKQIYHYGKSIVSKLKSPNTRLNWLFPKDNGIRFYLLAILFGLGICMTLSGAQIHPHYLIIAFPFTYIFMVKLWSANLKFMKILIISQLCLTLLFMIYVHQNQGIERGDYSKSYKYKIENGIYKLPK